MIYKKALITLLISISINFILCAQIDTTLIKTITKLQLLREVPLWNGHKLDKNIVIKLVSAPIKIKVIQSTGFENFIFTFVQTEDLNLQSDSIVFFTNCKGYILAIDTLNIESYRISGFFENDMLKLLMHLKRTSNHSGFANKFSKYYSVEGLDLKCLYRAAKKNSRDTKKYPCLKYCGETIWVY